MSQYADYLIASEETEPGVGWYYTDWLTAFGAEIRRIEIQTAVVEFKVQVGTGGQTGGAYLRDFIPHRYLSAGGSDLAAVGV